MLSTGKKLFFCMFLMVLFAFPLTGHAETKAMELNSSVTGKTSVKLSWKKKSVSGYEIYRTISDRNESEGKYELIATLSGGKTSYKDKVTYKKYYRYRIKAFKKSGKKKTYKYEGDCTVFAGVGTTLWHENLRSDAKVSTKSIQLQMELTEGMTPDGFNVYRSVGSLAYRKIASIKTKKRVVSYTDKDVVAGTSYTYKVRAFRKISGKTIYGAYSDPICLSAVNQLGKYTLRTVTEGNADVSSFTLAITSDENNADTIFSGTISSEAEYRYSGSGTKKDEWLLLEAVKYSFDNKSWHKLSKKEVLLKPGKTIYLQFRQDNGKKFYYVVSDAAKSVVENLCVGYNDLYALMDMDLLKMTAEAERDGERYH